MVRSGIFHHSLSGIKLDKIKDDEAQGENSTCQGSVGKEIMEPRMVTNDNKADQRDQSKKPV